MLTLREIRYVLRANNIRPNKRLGQSFLIDRNVRDKIINSVGLKKEDIVLEIGPGLGALTEELCRDDRKVIAIEKDRRLYDYLCKNFPSHNLAIINSDILKYELSKICVAGEKFKVIGNLPYYISSPILTLLLNSRAFIDTIFITVQKELSERLTANTRPSLKLVGSSLRGAISYFVEYYGDIEEVFNIKRKAFYPIPQVDSCLLKIVVRPKGLFPTDEERLFKIIRAGFSKKRKTILNSLYTSGLFSSKDILIDKLRLAGISPHQRPETISLEEFGRLANLV